MEKYSGVDARNEEEKELNSNNEFRLECEGWNNIIKTSFNFLWFGFWRPKNRPFTSLFFQ